MKYFFNLYINFYDYFNIQIMIRTKGSGRASGRVIGRAQGREVSHDADEAHQWQRPTTSTRRQREATYVVKEVQHVNHVDDEVQE